MREVAGEHDVRTVRNEAARFGASSILEADFVTALVIGPLPQWVSMLAEAELDADSDTDDDPVPQPSGSPHAVDGGFSYDGFVGGFSGRMPSPRKRGSDAQGNGTRTPASSPPPNPNASGNRTATRRTSVV